MTHVTCRLTAKNRDQLRNPPVGSRVWATFSFFSSWPLLAAGQTGDVQAVHLTAQCKQILQGAPVGILERLAEG